MSYRRPYNPRKKAKRDSTPDSSGKKKEHRIPVKVPPSAPGSSDPDNSPTYCLNKTSSAYYGWKLYFSNVDYDEDSPMVKNIRVMEGFIRRNPELFSVEKLKTGVSYNIDINALYSDEIFMGKWSRFKCDLKNKPRETLNCLGLAIHQSIANAMMGDQSESPIDDAKNLPMIRAKILNYGPVIDLRNLKLSSYGKLKSIKGYIIRVGGVKHLAQWIVFSCVNLECPVTVAVNQPDGIYKLPTRCKGCTGRKFNPMLDSPHTRTVTIQIVRMQENLGDAQDDRGRVPRVVDIELTEELVNTCMPGDEVTVTGIIKANVAGGRASKGHASNEFSLCMEAVCVINNKDNFQTKSNVGIELNHTDYYAIREIHDQPNLFRLLVHSLCPAIHGHEIIKAGLILGLFGGSARHPNLRDDIHILMVGDPGIGKSQMLQACARVASKGIYVCGNASTSSGLTATLVREPGTGEFLLEAGALVLADKGCCCIDEFDKMPTQHQALLEAMEQQSVSLAKSGIVCSLPARTSILAAANPQQGRYNKSKTMKENLNISQPLLSRFDLVFILLDQPDERMDRLLSKHVMALHGVNEQARSQKSGASISRLQSCTVSRTLREKLSVSTTEAPLDIIPHHLVRKYISYARQYVRPMISQEAGEVLKTFYLELRDESKIEDGVSICIRKMEALIRLTEARAKLELREEATIHDALEVVEMVNHTRKDAASDDLRPSILQSSSGKVTKSKIQAFMLLVKNQAIRENNDLFTTVDLQSIARKGNVTIDDFTNFISILNEQGFLLKKRPNLYKLVI